jgi:3-oxoacyl-[acyl-carrier protein] reductase
MSDFTGKVVLITGASRGLGRAMALSFSQRGAHVGIGFAAREREAKETLAGIREGEGSGELCPFDVRDREATDQAIRALADRRGRLDVLVNNAGVAVDGFAAALSVEEWRRVLDVNLTGTFHGCRSAAAVMMARKSGVIINVASVAALHPNPGQANYAASKGGVLALTRTLAVELAPKGIRVNAVVPGLFRAGMGARLNHRVVESAIADIPLRRLGTPEELSRVVVFLASDAASYLIGQAIVVDGGLTL